MDSKDLDYKILTNNRCILGNKIEANDLEESYYEYKIGLNPKCEDEFVIEDSIGRFTIIRLQNISELIQNLVYLKELSSYNVD